LLPRGEGSLTTSYTGTIDANLGETAIQFTSAALDANINGDYRPEADGVPGIMAADYGGTFRLRFWRRAIGRLNVAFRDVSVGLESEPLTLTDNTFDAGGLLGNIGGAMDYIGRGLLTPVKGSRATIGVSDAANGAGVGTLSRIGRFEEIDIPIELTFAIDLNSPVPAAYREVLLTLSGNIVATRELPPGLPEPVTAALLAVGGLSLLRRRRRT
jgi:hypothetical protein